MYTRANKKTRHSQSPANDNHQQQSGRSTTAQFTDHRPEAVAQGRLSEMANNSPQVKQAVQLQAMADHHSDKQQRPVKNNENNTGLPDNLKMGIENLSGYAMDDVRVHYNSDKPAQLQARAYAQGTDIHLGTGQEKHLPHEAWHVVQQKQGRVKPTVQMKGNVNINDDGRLENEANMMGARALQSQPTEANNRTENTIAQLQAVVQRGGAAVDQNAEENKQAVGRGIQGIQGLINELDEVDEGPTYSVGVMVRYPDWGNYLKAKGGHAAIQIKVEFGDQRGTKYIQAGVSATGSIQIEPIFHTTKTRKGYNIKQLTKSVDKEICINVLKGVAKEIATAQPYQERIIINKGSSTNCSLWAAKMAAIARINLSTVKMWVFPSPNDLQHALDYYKTKDGYTLTDSIALEEDAVQIDVNIGGVPGPQFDEEAGEIIFDNLTDQEVDELKTWARQLD